MKPSELYALAAVANWNNISVLVGFHYNHVPEIENLWPHLKLDKNDRVTIRVYGYRREDVRRFWLLAGVFLDNQPVMIIQNAGREGDDHCRRFITDRSRYMDMWLYLSSLYDGPRKAPPPSDEVAVDQDISQLTDFYGMNLI